MSRSSSGNIGRRWSKQKKWLIWRHRFIKFQGFRRVASSDVKSKGFIIREWWAMGWVKLWTALTCCVTLRKFYTFCRQWGVIFKLFEWALKNNDFCHVYIYVHMYPLIFFHMCACKLCHPAFIFTFPFFLSPYDHLWLKIGKRNVHLII